MGTRPGTERGRWPRVLLAGTVGVALTVGVSAAWIPVERSAPSVDVALVLVAVTAAVGFAGRRAAVVGAAAGAAAGFSFFDTEPYQRWAITHASDVVTAVLLVVVGLAAGELALRLGRQRRGRVAEDQRFERIREAATRLAQGEELVPMIGSVAAQIQTILRLDACRFSTEEGDEDLPVFDRAGLASAAPGEGAAVPVLSQGVVVGRFVLRPGPLTTWERGNVLLAVTLADQVGAALAAQAPPIDPLPGAGAATGPPPGPKLRVVR